jgi:hypothetical protein
VVIKKRGRNNVPLGNDDVNAINALGQVNLLDLTLNQRDNCWPQREQAKLATQS